MSYTPPAASAADFHFSGITYVGGADFSWDLLNTRAKASGFITTIFGAPHHSFVQAGQATGWAAPGFGAPVVFAAVTAQASGITTTQFGLAKAVYGQRATGVLNAPLFGLPNSPYLQTLQPEGFCGTHFGHSFVTTYLPPNTHQSVSASSWLIAMFGMPSASTQISLQASGCQGTVFGVHGLRLGQRASSLLPATTFGAPSISTQHRAVGFRSMGLGTPTSQLTQTATSLHNPARFGVPGYYRVGAHLAQSLRPSVRFGRPNAGNHAFSLYTPARFGQPAAWHLHAYLAIGSTAAQFGTPACSQRYRAFHIYPSIRFGKTQLVRSPTC